MSQPVLVGVLLAAGRGTRFDPLGHRSKLLAEIDGHPVLWHSAAHLREVVDRLVVVHRSDSPALAALLGDSADLLSACADAHLGMGHSLAHGVREAQRACDPDAILVGLADMPFIQATTLHALAALGRAEGSAQIIAAPRFQGQRGHPVLFGKNHFTALLACSGDSGASALLRNGPVQWVEVDDPGVIRDIDRPEDLTTPGVQTSSPPAKRP